MKTHEERKAYSCGYAAAAKRVERLEREIERLKSLPPKAAGKCETIEYLLSTSEVLARAAALLIDSEAPPATPQTAKEGE